MTSTLELESAEALGRRIRQALHDADLSQTELARRLAGPSAGRTQVQSARRLVAKWLRGEHVPSPDYARRLAEQLDKPLLYFTVFGIDASDVSSDPQLGANGTAHDAVEAISLAREVVGDRAPEVVAPFGRDVIEQIVPAVNPDLILLDRVEELDPGESASGRKRFTKEDWSVGPLYRGTEIVPGVVVLEALAQLGAVVMISPPHRRGKIAYCAGFEAVRFRSIVRIGDELELRSRVRSSHLGVSHLDATALAASGQTALTARILLALND